MQARWIVAAVFFILAIDFVRRNMPRTQFLRRQTAPGFYVDALLAFDTEQALRRTRYRTDSLVHGIDEVHARSKGFVGTRYAADRGAALHFTQTLPKAAVTACIGIVCGLRR